jgi:hypothetical protein
MTDFARLMSVCFCILNRAYFAFVCISEEMAVNCMVFTVRFRADDESYVVINVFNLLPNIIKFLFIVVNAVKINTNTGKTEQSR